MLAENLKYQLDQKKWSSATLSRESGIHRTQISGMLRGRIKDPCLKTLKKLSSALDVTIDELAYGQHEEGK